MSEGKKYCKEAVISLALAFITIIFIYLFTRYSIFFPVFTIASIVFGISALRKIKKEPELAGRALAIIGIVLSSLITLIFAGILWLVLKIDLKYL
jgi:hypothetical protein